MSWHKDMTSVKIVRPFLSKYQRKDLDYVLTESISCFFRLKYHPCHVRWLRPTRDAQLNRIRKDIFQENKNAYQIKCAFSRSTSQSLGQKLTILPSTATKIHRHYIVIPSSVETRKERQTNVETLHLKRKIQRTRHRYATRDRVLRLRISAWEELFH